MAVAVDARVPSKDANPSMVGNKQKQTPSSKSTSTKTQKSKHGASDALRVGALGGCAAAFSVQTLMFPLNTVKTRLQARAPHVSKQILRKTLFKGLYRGFVIDTLGSVPGTGVFMATYEALKLTGLVPPAVAATVAGVAGSLLVAPCDAIKQRLQVDATKTLKGELIGIAKSKSPIRRAFVGYPQFLARDLPFDAIQVTTFDALKRWHGKTIEPDRHRTKKELALMGAAAGAFTGIVTTPMDVARTAEVCAAQFGIECKGASCVVALIQKGGPQVLLRGAVPRVLEISLGGAVYFSALEAAKRSLGWDDFETGCGETHEKENEKKRR